MKALSFGIVNSLRIMTGERGIQAGLPLYTSKIALRKEELRRSPFYGFLSTSQGSGNREFDERDPSAINSVNFSSEAQSAQKEMCLRSAVHVDTLESHILHSGGEGRMAMQVSEAISESWRNG